MMGISNRQYARQRGVNERAIRDRRDDGTLAQAILPDGKLDPEIADRLLAERTTAGNRTGSGLNEARKRKLAARVALIADEVRKLQEEVVDSDIAGPEVAKMMKFVADRLFLVADRASPLAVGKPAPEAAEIIQEEAIAALTELSSTEVVASEEAPQEAAGGLPLSTFDHVALAALKADLEAERLEIQRQLNRGEKTTISEIAQEMAARMSNTRGRVLGIHAKVAPHCVASRARRCSPRTIHRPDPQHGPQGPPNPKRDTAMKQTFEQTKRLVELSAAKRDLRRNIKAMAGADRSALQAELEIITAEVEELVGVPQPRSSLPELKGWAKAIAAYNEAFPA